METCSDNGPIVYLCRTCGMRFESGIADAARGGGERCPQCFLEDLVPLTQDDSASDAFVVRRGTRFR